MKVIKQDPFDKKVVLNKDEAERLFSTDKPAIKSKWNSFS